jgi:hypothetical protein
MPIPCKKDGGGASRLKSLKQRFLFGLVRQLGRLTSGLTSEAPMTIYRNERACNAMMAESLNGRKVIREYCPVNLQENAMFNHGATYKRWAEKNMEDECYTQIVENGCHVEVRARETEQGDIEILIGVYGTDGEPVAERIQTASGREWTIEDALKRGVDQAERIAGGESGRLPCADADKHANE